MAKLLSTKSIYYKDVNLIAQPGIVKSRSEIPKRLDRIIVSPMAAICGQKFVKEALNLGLTIGLHRFCTPYDQGNIVLQNINSDNEKRIWVSVGLDDNDRLNYLYKIGCRNFIIDVANGYLKSVVEYTNKIKDSFKDINLMVGNVHTAIGLNLYNNIPNIHVRVGISSGTGCNTAIMTGINRGQATEIDECFSQKISQIIVADGGITCPAYASLAFGCGADKIMMGGYFAKAEEAENIQNGEYKFWGSASYKQLELSGSKKLHSEGKELKIEISEVKPLKILVEELWGGISSAISYSGFNNLNDFIGNATVELKV